MAREGTRILFVDYLQLIAPEDRREQRYAQVGGISRRLKLIARELKIPVVAMCQVNRAGDKEEPRLFHLRESGDIEADADNVLLLHDLDSEKGAEDKKDVGQIKVIIAKQRDGPLGVVPLVFRKRFMRFDCLGD